MPFLRRTPSDSNYIIANDGDINQEGWQNDIEILFSPGSTHPPHEGQLRRARMGGYPTNVGRYSSFPGAENTRG